MSVLARPGLRDFAVWGLLLSSVEAFARLLEPDVPVLTDAETALRAMPCVPIEAPDICGFD